MSISHSMHGALRLKYTIGQRASVKDAAASGWLKLPTERPGSKNHSVKVGVMIAVRAGRRMAHNWLLPPGRPVMKVRINPSCICYRRREAKRGKFAPCQTV